MFSEQQIHRIIVSFRLKKTSKNSESYKKVRKYNIFMVNIYMKIYWLFQSLVLKRKRLKSQYNDE